MKNTLKNKIIALIYKNSMLQQLSHNISFKKFLSKNIVFDENLKILRSNSSFFSETLPIFFLTCFFICFVELSFTQKAFAFEETSKEMIREESSQGNLKNIDDFSPSSETADAKIPVGIGADGKSLDTQSEEPWYIYADELVSLHDGVVLEGTGSVLLVRGEDYLKADFARLYTNTQWIYLRGNVVAKLGADELKSTEAEFDLNSTSGWVQNADIFMAGPHMYFSGTELYKEKGDVYTIKNAMVTVCDGDVPLWSLEAQSARVEADAYASFNHSRFQIKDVPVLYTPYMVIPTKTTRQTGLLQPSYGISSRLGVYFTQPFFYVIDQSRDLTFYGSIFTDRGFMPSIEYRSHTKQNQKTWLAADILHDSKTVYVDSAGDYDYSDGKVRENNWRYWLRGMGNGDVLEGPWQYKFNLDYVSDQNFLREFQNRMTGFDETESATYLMFGRDFENIDANRVTEGYIFRDWSRLTLSGGIRYEQDPSLGNGNTSYSDDETVQQLPTLGAYWNKGPLLGYDKQFADIPINLQAAITSTYMYRATGTQGFRTEVYPKVSVPVDLRYASMELNAGARSLIYHNTVVDNTALTSSSTIEDRKQQNGTSSVIPDFGVSLYTQATRTWEWSNDVDILNAPVGESAYTAMRHSFQPRISYSYVADVDQENNPYYSIYDRVQDQDNFEISFDNHFVFKKETVVRTVEGISLKTTYHDLLRVRLSSGYDFREEKRTDFTDTFENRPWYDFRLLLSTNPTKWLTLSTDLYYSPYDNDLTRWDAAMTLRHTKYGSITSSYSMRKSTYNYHNLVNYDNIDDIVATSALEAITNTLQLKLTPRLHVYFKDVLNLETGENYERIVGVGFNHQCMRIYGEYSKDATEESFHLNIEFTGLGF